MGLELVNRENLFNEGAEGAMDTQYAIDKHKQLPRISLC